MRISLVFLWADNRTIRLTTFANYKILWHICDFTKIAVLDKTKYHSLGGPSNRINIFQVLDVRHSKSEC